MSATGVLVEGESLARLRAEIRERLGDRYNVHELVPDALAGSCLVLTWGDPWLEPMTACNYTARPAVACVAGRIGVEGGQVILEEMVAYVLGRLRGLARSSSTIERVDTPGLTTWGNVEYLAARVTLRAVVTL